MLNHRSRARAIFAAVAVATISIAALLSAVAPLPLAASKPQAETLTPTEAQALVQRALAEEVRMVHDPSHPMRFHLRKQSPRLTTSKDIIETRDGAVARLFAVNDQPLDTAGEQGEQARLDQLERDPSLQQHRKHGEDGDAHIVMKILTMMPSAFLYQYQGMGPGLNGPVQKFTFRPNPQFSPSDMETQALTALTGELWIDAAGERVVRLAGSLAQDTSYGWGILGKLNKGGWVELEQSEVAPHIWRITHVQLKMTLRIVVKTKVFDTDEQMRDYTPVPAGIDYRTAIHMLRAPAVRPTASRGL
jgi:hypothetical protein